MGKKVTWRKFINWWTPARSFGITLALLALILTLWGKVRLEDLTANTVAELASIALTILIIDGLNQRRAERQELNDLILQMGSPDNAFAREAVRKLRARDLFDKGVLRKVNLSEADLQGAHLVTLDMREAMLHNANLKSANLVGANLNKAFLVRANLRDSKLQGADLSEAYLNFANLRNAKLQFSDQSIKSPCILLGASMSNVKLNNADVSDDQLAQADSLRGAFMPSGYRYNGRFNLKSDIANYEVMVAHKAAGSIADFFGVSEEIYQRGQDWHNRRNEQLMYNPDLEELMKILDNPDGEDLYVED